MSGKIDTRNRSRSDLVIDNVLSTQAELGPSIPDGGYGWIVFLVTLFFQLLIPSLLVSFGILLAFSRMKFEDMDGINIKLWDHPILNAPLFFIASWTVWDPTSRQFITHSKWPKLFATAGTCLICSGLLFLWMGMTGDNGAWLFILCGIVSGVGASIQMAQCHILLAQYFRLKLPILTHLSHATSAVGFILAPIILGHHILKNSQTEVILWYQAIILQGIVLNLFLRKPMYLKSKNVNSYDYVMTHADDEEDLFSKNFHELQLTAHSQHRTQIRTRRLSDTVSNDRTDKQQEFYERTKTETENENEKTEAKNWKSFEDNGEEVTKYESVKKWELFDEETEVANHSAEAQKSKQWVSFEDEANKTDITRNQKSLHLELSFGDIRESEERPSTQTITGMPIPLFSEAPVNNNINYSYDILEDRQEGPQSFVFLPIPTNSGSSYSLIGNMRNTVKLLRQPTFYKSFITVMTIKWSLFVFFVLYPSFLLREVKEIKLSHLANLVGTISLTTVFFAAAAYWIHIEKKSRSKAIWFLSWIGALGYFMISDYVNEGLLIFGAVQIVFSITALDHVGGPLLCLTVKGESTKEYTLICLLTGISFLFFLVVDASLKQIFRLMALLNFLTGCLWLANYIYKRLFK